jgi:hypothetical protein
MEKTSETKTSCRMTERPQAIRTFDDTAFPATESSKSAWEKGVSQKPEAANSAAREGILGKGDRPITTISGLRRERWLPKSGQFK